MSSYIFFLREKKSFTGFLIPSNSPAKLTAWDLASVFPIPPSCRVVIPSSIFHASHWFLSLENHSSHYSMQQIPTWSSMLSTNVISLQASLTPWSRSSLLSSSCLSLLKLSASEQQHQKCACFPLEGRPLVGRGGALLYAQLTCVQSMLAESPHCHRLLTSKMRDPARISQTLLTRKILSWWQAYFRQAVNKQLLLSCDQHVVFSQKVLLYGVPHPFPSWGGKQEVIPSLLSRGPIRGLGRWGTNSCFSSLHPSAALCSPEQWRSSADPSDEQEGFTSP